MQKTILALAICALLPSVYIAVAYADGDVVETRGVAQRVSCDDIKSEMDSLSAIDGLDDADAARLAELKSDYRSRCMKSAGRRSTGRTKPVINMIAEQPGDGANVAGSNVSNGTCDVPDANGCCPGETYKDLGDLGFNCCTKNDEHCFPPMQVGAAGGGANLCDDGAAPNADGCCAGETFTDLGDLGFNCCQADGTTCFPPMK